jgi:transcriptional regulator with XRE-family HTH domain
MNPFAENFRRLRVNRRMQQKELARYLNLDASSICQLEAGRRGPLSRKQLDQLAILLQLSKEEEEQLLVDARISHPLRKVPTAAGRERLLVLDALLEKLEVLTNDQISLIAKIIEMRMDPPALGRWANKFGEEGGNTMQK